MIILSDMHTHTSFCDGHNTVAEMAKAAFDKGMLSFGFSGHAPAPQNYFYVMTSDGFKEYIKQVNEQKEIYKDKMDVLLGVELDLESTVDKNLIDYCIGSVHQLFKNGQVVDVDNTKELQIQSIEQLFNGSFDNYCETFFEATIQSAVRECVDIIGHFDLIRKFNINGDVFNEQNEKYKAMAFNAVDTILSKKPNALFEVNTGAISRGYLKKPYPSELILNRIYQKGGRIIINSDSHSTKTIMYGFSDAVELCRNAGFNELTYLCANGFKEVKIN